MPVPPRDAAAITSSIRSRRIPPVSASDVPRVDAPKPRVCQRLPWRACVSVVRPPRELLPGVRFVADEQGIARRAVEAHSRRWSVAVAGAGAGVRIDLADTEAGDRDGLTELDHRLDVAELLVE